MIAKFRTMAGGSKLRREVGVVHGFPCLLDAFTKSSSRNTSRSVPHPSHPPILHFLTSKTQKTTASLILPAIKACYQIAFSLSFFLFKAKSFVSCKIFYLLGTEHSFETADIVK